MLQAPLDPSQRQRGQFHNVTEVVQRSILRFFLSWYIDTGSTVDDNKRDIYQHDGMVIVTIGTQILSFLLGRRRRRPSYFDPTTFQTRHAFTLWDSIRVGPFWVQVQHQQEK
jgi:hypothetical protein